MMASYLLPRWPVGDNAFLTVPVGDFGEQPRGRHVHVLKSTPAAFQAQLEGSKHCEVRRADRDFVDGDVLVLLEYDPAARGTTFDPFTGRALIREVSHVDRGGPGSPCAGLLNAGACVLSTEDLLMRGDDSPWWIHELDRDGCTVRRAELWRDSRGAPGLVAIFEVTCP
jgi:hypothetical protein